MIRLISQFDNEKTRLSLATPTCGCCSCCCCCCVVSTIAASSVSARNFGNYVNKIEPGNPKKAKEARLFAYFYPLGVIGCFILGLIADMSINNDFIYTAIISSILYLIIAPISFNKKKEIKGFGLRMLGIVALTVAFEVAGFFAGLYIILSDIAPLYMVAGIVVCIMLTIWAFNKKYDGSDNTESQIDNDDIEESTNDSKIVYCTKCGAENVSTNDKCVFCSAELEK